MKIILSKSKNDYDINKNISFFKNKIKNNMKY